jgi:hypothetical protein
LSNTKKKEASITLGLKRGKLKPSSSKPCTIYSST